MYTVNGMHEEKETKCATMYFSDALKSALKLTCTGRQKKVCYNVF